MDIEGIDPSDRKRKVANCVASFRSIRAVVIHARSVGLREMSQLTNLDPGSRYDLRVGKSPDAPDEAALLDDGRGAFGYAHSYETSSRYDGPGVRVVLFLSGCLLRCQYCHNPDTWHLKDGSYISAQHVLNRLASFATALQSLRGGLTITGGEPLV